MAAETTPAKDPRSGRPPPAKAAAARSVVAASAEPAVVITGIVGRLGRRLARRLHREGRVIGIDRRPFEGRPKDIEHHQIDIRRKKTRDIFRGTPIRAVVHLGVMHDPRASASEHHTWNVAGFQKILEYVAQYEVPKLVLLSSANVYGPRPENPQFLTEDAPLLGGAAFSEIRDLVEIDMLAQSFFWKRPETETVILRPVHILGTVRNAPSNYLRLPVIPTLLGFDPMIQVLHEEDTVRAIELALRPGVRGVFNIAGPPPAPLSRVVKTVGRPTVPIPHAFAATMLKPLFQLRMASFPKPELDHIRYVCMVDDQKARETLGYAPSKSLEETVRAVDDGRWS
ncbi:MAG TPA: NAD-dependent epimerase/dehydratase family protein [Polyangiaceae bacterium]